MPTSFLPVSDGDRLAWLTNFKNKIGGYATTFGITAAEVTAVTNDHSMYQYLVQGVENVKLFMHALIALRRSLRASSQSPMGTIPAMPSLGTAPAAVQTGIFARVNALVYRIKHHASYTTAIGQDLDIITPVSTFNPATIKPELTVKLDSGYPVIRYVKGEADGIKLYVDRRDSNGFVELDTVLKTKYIDGQALPPSTNNVTWDYKAKYIIGGDEIGLESDVVTITVIRV
jgi:hypothetical protein